MDFTSLFNMQGMMFCILALGWYLRKSGMIDKSGKALLSSLVMNVTLPASIVKSFQMEFSMNILKLTLEVIVISFLIQIFSNLLSRVLYPGWSEESKKVLQYATIVSNAGILGNAIAEGIFGDLGIMYAAVYTIPTRIFMWSVGLTYFTEAPTKKELLKKVVTHPCIIGIFTGMVLLVSQFQLPGFENVTRRVNRPQLNLDAPSSVSIEELIKVSQDTVTRTEDDKKEPKRVQPASPIPLTYYEEIYRAESSANVTQFPSCFVSNATLSTQSPDTSRFHLYQTALKRSASEEVRLFSFAESIKPYSHHAPFYNPSFTSPSFTLILPLKWTLLPLPN